MASRKEQKEQARARREAEERARAARQRQQRRLRMVIGSVLVAVAIVAVLIAVSSGGGSASALQTGASSAKTMATVQKLLTGVPQSGVTLGSSSAPVTMTYYGDLQCPICRDFTLTGGFEPLVANEVRAGKVKIVYKAFETATKDPSVFRTQQVAALAAGQQQRFWNFAELFYREQGTEGSNYVTESYLSGLAKQIPGFNLAKWQTDRSSSTLATSITTDEQAGTKLGVQGTPTLIMTGPKGSAVPGNGAVPTYSDLQTAYKKVA